MERKTNFGAGPAKLPESVLEKIKDELLSYNGLGVSVLEMSHRSADFAVILDETEKLLRELMGIPEDYAVLFMHGGGTGQFAALPLNLKYLAKDADPTADYLITGAWSQKAAKEAEKYVFVNKVVNNEKKFTFVPNVKEWKIDTKAAYLYFCANETIHGIELGETPLLPANVNLVVDISSNILSRVIDVPKYAAIIAGTQKNLGIGGLTIVIIRKELIGKEDPKTPGVLNYANMLSNKSLYNTPCVFAVYVTKLVLEWIKSKGGVEEMSRLADAKSRLIYDLIDSSNGFYHSNVEQSVRSRMNIPFRIRNDTTLEAEFLKEAAALGMISLKGHRSVGGIRASLYNAVSMEETQRLADHMKSFMEKYK